MMNQGINMVMDKTTMVMTLVDNQALEDLEAEDLLANKS
jgi:hypothetical protein